MNTKESDDSKPAEKKEVKRGRMSTVVRSKKFSRKIDADLSTNIFFCAGFVGSECLNLVYYNDVGNTVLL